MHIHQYAWRKEKESLRFSVIIQKGSYGGSPELIYTAMLYGAMTVTAFMASQ